MAKLSRLLAILGCFLAATAPAQQSPVRYSIGVVLFGPNAACPAGPVFVDSVYPDAPAGIAGIHAGDLVLAVDGAAVKDMRDAATRMSATQPGTVVLQVRRNGEDLTFSIPRERSDAMWSRIWSNMGVRQLDDGLQVPMDFTDAQVRDDRKMHSDLEKALQAGEAVNVFPGHYPKDLSLYYPGFELFAWDHGQTVIVGGIENGPARASGVRWGDRIVAVNGIDARGKSLSELEQLFSSSRPDSMHLEVNRFGADKQFTFLLAPASDVLKASGWRMFEGAKVPVWVPDAYARCFE
jgi:C-terminal processing protease CtpA/Prc